MDMTITKEMMDWLIALITICGGLGGGVALIMRLVARRFTAMESAIISRIGDVQGELDHHKANHSQTWAGASAKLAEHDRSLVRLETEMAHLRANDADLSDRLDTATQDIRQDIRDLREVMLKRS